MKNVIGYVCAFMAVIIVCTLCGGLFGIVAGGTFSESVAGFGKTINVVKHGLIDPFNEFLSYFGLSSSYGGSALVYRLEDDEVDIKFSDIIPEGAHYCSFHMTPLNANIPITLRLKYFYFIFFDKNGDPLEAKVFTYSTYKLVTPSKVTYTSVDCSRSYYNAFAKYLYADLDVYVYNSVFDRNDVLHISLNSALLEYEYYGNFSKLDSIIGRGNGTGGKF